MADDVLLPQWGMEMQDGTIVKWLKKEGDPVEEGEPLVEIETSKIETELEATASGILAHILVTEGSTVAIRTVLAIIATPGEVVARPSSATAATQAPASPMTSSTPAVAPSPQSMTQTGAQVVPAARRLAVQHGIDLSLLQGTGPGGRILIADVEKAVEAQVEPLGKVIPIKGMRQAIASRMLGSLQTMAQVTVTTEVDMTEAMTLMEEQAPNRAESRLSPLHLVIKAVARALLEHPRMNALHRENRIEMVEDINVGLAVSLSEGLIVPTLRQADGKALAEIAAEARDLAKRAREGEASPEEVTGGTFTITNLGAYDIDAFTPIINPPQVGILGVGRMVEKPAVHLGEITKRSMMVLSLTFDHTVVDGGPAAEFLRAVKGHLEEPGWMISPLPAEQS